MLAVNNNTSVNSGDWIRCFKRLARTNVQMSLVDVNQIYVINEAMNGCKNQKIN